MKPDIPITHQFVEYIPDTLDDGVLYVSIPFATAAHRCSCGCTNEVITPISPTDWKLIFDGQSVSLNPSIGNWNFPCRSHYWIRGNTIQWAPAWTQEEIEAGRAQDRRMKTLGPNGNIDAGNAIKGGGLRNFWRSLKQWFA